LDQSLLDLVGAGLVNTDDVLKVAHDTERMLGNLKQ